MYEAEIHDTVERLEVREKLDFDLNITESEYQSRHEIEGELRAFAEPNDAVIRNRRHPPRNPLGLGDGVSEGFPGTTLHVGLSRVPPFEQDDEAFQEGVVTNAIEVDGAPENGTVELDLDWSAEEAERMRSENSSKVVSHEYEITEFPSDLLPVVVRANLYQDAREIASNRGILDGQSGADRSVQALTGLAALSIEIEVQGGGGNAPDALRVTDFRVDMARTFPDIDFYPRHNATYNPERQRIEWSNARIQSGDTKHYWILGPINELLDLGTVTASLRGEMPNHTLTGTQVEGVFDGSGSRFPDPPSIDERVSLTSTIEIDPTALRGETQKQAESTISASLTPQYLYERVVTICEREGIEIRERSPPGDPVPVPGRDRVFTVNEDEGNHGELAVRREFGNEGVVYANMTITGDYTATTQETEVSAFDESEDRLVKADEGALDERGESTVEVQARSTSAELNSKLIGAIEDGLSGGELK